MITKIDRQAVYKKYGGKCAYCGRDLEYRKMQVDHFIPKARKSHIKKAGLESQDDFKNLMPSCGRCNNYKGSLLPEAWRQRMEKLHKSIMKYFIVKIAKDYGIINPVQFDGKFYFEYCERLKKEETIPRMEE